MLLAEITLAGRQWLIPALVVLGAGLGLIVWSYYRSPALLWVRLVSAFLKSLGLMALLACILEPLWSGQRARPGANLFVICADNSEGMQIKDQGRTQTRGEILRQLLVGEQQHWQPLMEENFQVRRYLFDTRAQASRDFADLHFDGRASSLASAMKTIAQRLATQPVAGILLFTDGNATDALDGSIDVTGWPPIYPVVSGEDAPIKDIAIQRVAVTQTAFEDAPVSVQADVNTTGYAGRTVIAQLFEVPAPGSKPSPEPQAPPTEESAVAKADGDLVTFRFQVRPQRQGIIHYQLRVSARDALDQFAHPEKSSEATLANNVRTLVVDRGQGPYRVLYLSGRPNWEFKYLNRALTEDTQVELVGVIRVARREPKFQFKGRAGEASNPLFRGFDGKTEDTERYDQPVLVRLNTHDDQELANGFPKTAEELYPYHAVIVDDLEAEFFTAEQRALLQKFVSERGGGFLMLGGQESFQRGKYDRTPIGEMLPVYLDGPTTPEQFLGNLHLLYTREGWLQPWMRLRSTELEENTRLNDVPPFQVLNVVRAVKPGATVMAQVATDSGQRHPALVVQRFGRGRTGALLLGDLWHWGLSDESLQRDLAKGWRQLVRWLVADVPGRITLQAQIKESDPNQPMQFQVRVRDKEFQPLDNAAVTIQVEPIATRGPGLGNALTPDQDPHSGVVHLPAEPATTEPGLYEATYVPRQTGGYYTSATATNASGVQVGKAEAGWTSDLAAEEFRSLRPNRALLEMLATRTKGEIIRADKLEDFARGLPHRPVPITENYTAPLWHQPIVFLLALACFVIEWGLRRWKGLA